MKEYNKSSKLEHVAYDIRGPVLEEAMRMRANGEKILRLNTGNPAEFGFTAPDEVIHDLIMNARDSEGYSDSKGIFSARKAIMQYCQLKKIPNVDIDDIYLGNGVRFTIFVMKKQTGIQILKISSRKSPQTLRLSLSSTRITQQVPSIQMRSCLRL